MKSEYRIYRRKGTFYLHHIPTGKRESLFTKDKNEAHALLAAKLESHRQPQLNLKMARVYLSASDPKAISRTWGDVLASLTVSKRGANQERWMGFAKHPPCQSLWSRVVIETRAEDLPTTLNAGTVSTNKFLRILHNFALDMGWLQAPVIPKRQWPQVEYASKRAITWEEHKRIVQRETNSERRDFYELAWFTGASQSDLAHLCAENVNWTQQTITFSRQKTGQPVILHFGEETALILKRLPWKGEFFPYLAKVRAGDRATEFKQRCRGLNIKGVTLHSYRYAWAERARKCGYPERFAMQALGHNSKAVHRAYARHAEVLLPSLEQYEEEFAKQQIIPFPSFGKKSYQDN